MTMEKYVILLTLLGLMAFAVFMVGVYVIGIPQGMDELLMAIQIRGHPIPLVAIQALLWVPVIFIPGYLVSFIIYKGTHRLERILVSFALGFLTYGIWHFSVQIPAGGPVAFFKQERFWSLVWVLLMLGIYGVWGLIGLIRRK